MSQAAEPAAPAPAPAAPAAPSAASQIKADELEWLDPAALEFHWAGGPAPVRLTLREKRSVLRVFAAYAFPQSDPEHFIQFYEGKPDGGRGEPIGMLSALAGLDARSRETVAECLRRSYLVPRVIRILELRDLIYLVQWEVETDRGRCEFNMSNVRDQINPRENGRIVLKDMDGNQYEIADFRKLDEASRRMLSGYI